jgi:hypothetical protein
VACTTSKDSAGEGMGTRKHDGGDSSTLLWRTPLLSSFRKINLEALL